MRRTLIGGFLFLGGVIGVSIMFAVAAINPVDSWITPPGRYICTMLDRGLLFPAIIFLLVLILGAVILVCEYKNKQ